MTDRIIDALIKHLYPWFQACWNSLFFWRSLALGILLFLVIIYTYKAKIVQLLLKSEIREHDKKIFERLNEILDVTAARKIFDGIDRLIVPEEPMDTLKKFFICLIDDENRYLIRKIQKEAILLRESLDLLLTFTATHFFVNEHLSQENRLIFQLYPDLKDSPDKDKRKIYESRAEELTPLLNKAEDSFRSYRQTIKEILFV